MLKMSDNKEVINANNKSDVESPPPAGRALQRSPLDGGHAWLIVVAAGVAFFLGAGFAKSYTLVYEQLLLKFGKSATATAVVGSLHDGVKLCSSPAVSALLNIFGTQLVTIAGAVVTSVGFLMSSYQPNLFYMYITYGVITAIGENMVQCSAIIIVGQYFVKRRGIAMGLATSCFGIGGFVVALVLNFLFSEYGYSGAMLIYAGSTLHNIAVGMVFQPVPDKFLSNLRKQNEKETGEEQSDMLYRSNLSLAVSGSISMERLNSMGSIQSLRQDESDSVRKRMFKGRIDERKKSLSARSLTTKAVNNKAVKKNLNSGTICAKISQHFGFFMLKRFDFVAIMMIMFGAWSAFSVKTFLAGLGKEVLDLSTSNIAFILATAGAIEIVCRPASGAIFDLAIVEPFKMELWLIFGSTAGLALILLPLSNSYAVFFTLWTCHSVAVGCFHTQHIGIISDVVGTRNLPSATGLVRFMMGIAYLLGPTFGGMLKDYFGSYTYSFLSYGAVIILCSIMFKIVERTRKCLRV